MTIAPASDETFREIALWRYEPPYDLYDGDPEPVRNPERFFEVRDQHEALAGFYYFEPQPPQLWIGLGLRPDLTGRGLGRAFFARGLTFGRERYEPERVVLDVAAFNLRARRVYESAGFRVVSSYTTSFDRFGAVDFVVMTDDGGPAGERQPTAP